MRKCVYVLNFQAVPNYFFCPAHVLLPQVRKKGQTSTASLCVYACVCVRMGVHMYMRVVHALTHEARRAPSTVGRYLYAVLQFFFMAYYILCISPNTVIIHSILEVTELRDKSELSTYQVVCHFPAA